MSYLAVNENIIAVNKGLHVDYYDGVNHKIININSNNSKDDTISDIVISSDNKHLALITSSSKQLIVYDLPEFKENKVFALPRSASKIRFTVDNTQILVADKTGDALAYNILTEDTGTKLLGHLSLLLNILQTSDKKYIITADRDEKIKVTCYPNTYNIHTYCLGHKEFVNNLELLPHNNKCLISTSGDGTIKCWDYKKGNLTHTIDTYSDVNDVKLKEEFKTSMDEEGIEVDRLPIILFTTAKISDSCSVIITSIHLVKKLFIYILYNEGDEIKHKLVDKLELEECPSAIQTHNLCLFVYMDITSEVMEYKIHDNPVSINFVKKIPMFKNMNETFSLSSDQRCIKMLYKRKFDNMQEYQERKKQRLGIA